ncbi:hypothetical protein F4804DRAFT_137220 [Jackrogersella minutella]|nr:hypothetical protein F4804DRAFT_137220 [Jackrogersella minutella]
MWLFYVNIILLINLQLSINRSIMSGNPTVTLSPPELDADELALPWSNRPRTSANKEQLIDDGLIDFMSLSENVNGNEQIEGQAQYDAPADLYDISKLTLISSAGSGNTTAAVRAETVIWVPVLPDYPLTDINGVCYVVNWERRLPEDDPKSVMNQIQYCKARIGSPRDTQSAFLNDSPVQRLSYICTGSKHCEYLDPILRNLSYCEVDQNYWDTYKEARRRTEAHIENHEATHAITYIRNILVGFQQGKWCDPFGPSCILEMLQEPDTITGDYRYFLHCVNSRPTSKHRNEPRHHFQYIDRQYYNSISIMQDILAGVETVNYGTCCTIKQNRSKRIACEYDHPQGKGKLLQATCNCKYELFIPKDLESNPYILVTSTGIHNHPIPPPSKGVGEIRNDIWEIISRIHNPGLNTSSFLQNPLLREWIRDRGKLRLSDVQPSLINDVFGYLIRRYRLLHFPVGSSLMAVHSLWNKQRGKPGEYIQEVYQDASNFMVICFNDWQFQLFKNLRTVVIGMNYKHLVNPTEREIIWAVYDEGIRRNVAVIRVITNSDTTEMYQFMFETVFSLLETKFHYNLKWAHIDDPDKGFIGLTIDQDWKLLVGFGHYLSSHYPQYSWRQHVQHTVRFCRVHFQRGVERYTGPRIGNPREFDLLMKLLDVSSQHDYLSLCLELMQPTCCGGKYVEWAKHKSRDAMSCGINPNCSKMARKYWDLLSETSNPAEVQHQRRYNYGGRYQYLLDCILRNQELDDRDFQSADIYKTYGIKYGYRNDGAGNHLTTMNQRVSSYLAKGRKRSRPQEDLALIIPSTEQPVFDVEELAAYSSSGSIRSTSLSPSDAASNARSTTSRASKRAKSNDILRRTAIATASQKSSPAPEIITSSQNWAATLKHREQELQLEMKEEELKGIRLNNRSKDLDLMERELDIEERRLKIEQMRRDMGL